MLIATITALILIFGGGNLEFYLTNLKKPVKEHVADKERRDAILDAGKELKKELKALTKDVEDHFEDIIKVHAEYESTTADYQAAGAKLKADQNRLTELVLDARDEMKKNMTRAEWEAVFMSSGD
jgi:peptidoglycan hydrolase CwlO-like protein